jgi:RHS repeat-associated protein
VSASGVDRLVEAVYTGAGDFSTAYAYDANGNMTTDLNRGIESITYDWNNMPREITFTSGAITRYIYDAAGRKLRAEYITPLTASANYALGPTPPIVPPLILYDLSTVDYHGDCVLRNDSLERVLTPNGYIASDTLHYYIKDYQGNVRSVVRHDGAVAESNEYYPYGGIFAATTSVQPHKYGAKELDRTHGLDLYDSEARWYDLLLGRTTTMDPLAEKYYSLSPYLWCAGNPVKNIDLKGDSVAVLLYDQSVIGHSALLIQNAEGKWAYYSYNGTSIYKKTNGFLGGKQYHDLGSKIFNSPEEFMNSTYNRKGSKQEVRNDEVNNYGFESAYVIPTTKSQDISIERSFRTEARKSYSLMHQCAIVVQIALDTVGIKSTYMSFSSIYDLYYPREMIPYMPLTSFLSIIYNNPNGKIINIK